MRGVHTFINDIRRQVFTEVARMAFEGGNYAETIRRLPHKIIPGEVAKYRQNILVERAVVTERIRLAIGLPLRDLSEYAPTDAQLEDSVIAEKYYEPPLINIISYACNACPTKQVRVTNMCQGCLAHPCMEVCPKPFPWSRARASSTRISASSAASAPTSAPMAPSCASSAPAQRPAAWTPSAPTSWAAPRSIMTSASPAVCAW